MKKHWVKIFIIKVFARISIFWCDFRYSKYYIRYSSFEKVVFIYYLYLYLYLLFNLVLYLHNYYTKALWRLLCPFLCPDYQWLLKITSKRSNKITSIKSKIHVLLRQRISNNENEVNLKNLVCWEKTFWFAEVCS